MAVLRRWRHGNIRSLMFRMMIALVVSVCFSFLTVIVVWQGVYHRKEKLQDFTAEVETIISKVDDSLKELKSVSLNVAFNASVNRVYTDFLTANTLSRYEIYLHSKNLSEVLLVSVDPTTSIPQVYLYNMNHQSFGFGLDYRYDADFKEDTYPFLNLESSQSGARFTKPHQDPRIASVQSYEKDQTYISVIRSLKNNLNTTTGYVEIIQRYHTIFEPLSRLGSGMRVQVYDREGECIYPLEDTDETAIFLKMKTYDFEEGIWRDWDHGQYLFYHTSSGQSGYHFFVALEKGRIYEGIWGLLILTFAIFAIIFAVFLVISYYLSDSLGRPITELSERVTAIDLSSDSELMFPAIDSNVTEVITLNGRIQEMTTRINESMERLMASKNQEMQLRVLALQAQTNPHFIYNILFTISAMAAADMNSEIEDMCGKVGELMRYASSSRSSFVTVKEELCYTEMYVKCMQVRFRDIDYKEEVSAGLREMRIPKFVIQLLVENSIKYCTVHLPPWKILVSVRCESGDIVIEVRDNGKGFDPEKVKEIRRQFRSIREQRTLPVLELNGMGIRNIYLRLLLLFGDQVKLELTNPDDGGARVTIRIPRDQMESEQR